MWVRACDEDMDYCHASHTAQEGKTSFFHFKGDSLSKKKKKPSLFCLFCRRVIQRIQKKTPHPQKDRGICPKGLQNSQSLFSSGDFSTSFCPITSHYVDPSTISCHPLLILLMCASINHQTVSRLYALPFLSDYSLVFLILDARCWHLPRIPLQACGPIESLYRG